MLFEKVLEAFYSTTAKGYRDRKHLGHKGHRNQRKLDSGIVVLVASNFHSS